jgi:hypothetical protein
MASVNRKGSVGKKHKPALDRTGITGLLADSTPSDIDDPESGGDVRVLYQAGQKLKLYHEGGRVAECIVAEDQNLHCDGGALETTADIGLLPHSPLPRSPHFDIHSRIRCESKQGEIKFGTVLKLELALALKNPESCSVLLNPTFKDDAEQLRAKHMPDIIPLQWANYERTIIAADLHERIPGLQAALFAKADKAHKKGNRNNAEEEHVTKPVWTPALDIRSAKYHTGKLNKEEIKQLKVPEFELQVLSMTCEWDDLEISDVADGAKIEVAPAGQYRAGQALRLWVPGLDSAVASWVSAVVLGTGSLPFDGKGCPAGRGSCHIVEVEADGAQKRVHLNGANHSFRLLNDEALAKEAAQHALKLTEHFAFIYDSVNGEKLDVETQALSLACVTRNGDGDHSQSAAEDLQMTEI